MNYSIAVWFLAAFDLIVYSWRFIIDVTVVTLLLLIWRGVARRLWR